MSDVYFSRIKLCFALMGSAGLFWLGVWMITIGGFKGLLFGGIVAASMAYMLVYFSRYLLDNKILSVGATGIEFHGMVSTRRLRTDQIATMMVESQTINGITTRTLVIEPYDGHGGKIKFAERWLERRFGGCEGVAELIANGPPEPQERRAVPARRIERDSTPAMPERARAGGFGRKGL